MTGDVSAERYVHGMHHKGCDYHDGTHSLDNGEYLLPVNSYEREDKENASEDEIYTFADREQMQMIVCVFGTYPVTMNDKTAEVLVLILLYCLEGTVGFGPYARYRTAENGTAVSIEQ